jgi:hypothetical protein
MKAIKTTKELKKRLAVLAEAISDNIEYPNSGGCGVIAAKVGSALQKLGVDCEVVTPTYRAESVPMQVRFRVQQIGSCKDWDRNGLNRNHLAVRVKHKKSTFCWDSDGLTKKDKFGTGGYPAPSKFGEGLTVEECKKISSRQKGWNSTFCRSQIPQITKLVNKYLLNGEVD